MYQPVLVPIIAAASISPAPVNINQKIKIIVTVDEEIIQIRPAFFFSGDAFSGEAYEPLYREAEPDYFFCGDVYAGEV